MGARNPGRPTSCPRSQASTQPAPRLVRLARQHPRACPHGSVASMQGIDGVVVLDGAGGWSTGPDPRGVVRRRRMRGRIVLRDRAGAQAASVTVVACIRAAGAPVVTPAPSV